MEKKMYNHPATEITEIESLHVIMDGTAPIGNNNPLTPTTTDDPDAPARYPKY